MKKLSLVLFLLVAGAASIFAQRTVTGKVVDAKGEGLIGASILAKGSTRGTVTDIDGAFSLGVPENTQILVISYTGFKTQEVTLGASNALDVTMESDAIGLDETVVIGYGTQSNRNRISSISTVNPETIHNNPLLGPQQLLQGTASGVQMTNTSGVLGSAAAIRIRGVSSINAGGNPLFVVDGVPLNDGSSGALSNAAGGTALNPLADINPNDIESMTVLKDAGASAIYGSRAANGVVLITTKKGKAGSNRVNLEYYTGFSKPTYTLDMMNADEYRGFVKAFNNQDAPATSFDWPKAVLQTGRINSYTVNMSGGSDKTQYYLSGSYLDQSNYAIGNTFKRYNGRLNLKHQVSNKLRFNTNIGLSRIDNDRIGADNNTAASLTSAYLQVPTQPAFDAAGNFLNTGFIQNVLAIEKLGIFRLLTTRVTANTSLSYDILPGLTAKTDWGVDLLQTEETSRTPNIVTTGGSAFNNVRGDNKWLTTNTLNYSKQFGDFAVDAIGGMSFEYSLFSLTSVAGSGFAADALRNVSSAATPTSTQANRTAWGLYSQFVRPTFRFKDRYIIEGSLRRDGSSRFGKEFRYGTFWSVNGGWILSEEGFLKNSTFINNLKLTASYGTTGNDRIGNFPSQGLYGSGVAFDYSGLPGLGPTQPANPKLRWEETAQADIGIQFSILKSRISVEANVWQKKTSNLLLAFQLPDVNGFSSITRNAGNMENKGVDILINTVNIKTRDFQWKSTISLSKYVNKVTNLPGASKDVDGNPFIAGTGVQRAIVGYAVNTFYLVRYKGINPATGNAEWLSKDGTSAVTTINPADRVIVGSAIPDYYGSFTNTISFKGFDLSAMLYFTKGNKVFLGDLNFTENPISGFNKSARLLNYWTENNKENAVVPSPTSATRSIFASNSTNQLLDGSFMRLRNVSLSYTLRSKQVGVKWFDSIRLYVMATNLWTQRAKGWAGRGQDPEIADAGNSNVQQGQSFFTAPQAKMIQMGVNVGF
jgi:TonB-dependent starch-binding outer membrane protein SusC